MMEKNLEDRFDSLRELPVSEETIGAFLEGNLSPAEEETVAALIDTDPMLAFLGDSTFAEGEALPLWGQGFGEVFDDYGMAANIGDTQVIADYDGPETDLGDGEDAGGFNPADDPFLPGFNDF